MVDKHTTVSLAVYSRWTSSNAPCLVPCVCRVSLNSFLFLSGPILWVGGGVLEMGHGENMGKVLAA